MVRKTHPRNAKSGDVITLKTKSLFNNDHDLTGALKVSPEVGNGLDTEVTFEITETNKRETITKTAIT